jgi:hypothetical protein
MAHDHFPTKPQYIIIEDFPNPTECIQLYISRAPNPTDTCSRKQVSVAGNIFDLTNFHMAPVSSTIYTSQSNTRYFH